MTGDVKIYIRFDPGGAWKVGKSDISLDSVLHAWNQGHSPESIRSQYPGLMLEDIYGAIAWALGHAEEVDGYLKRQEAVWASARDRARQDEAPVVKRLRELAKEKARGQ